MAEIIVKNGESLDKALKRFNREASMIKKEIRKREYYLTKKEKRKLKSKNNRAKKF